MNPRDSVMTRAAIVDAASKLLEDSGPEAVTLRAVGEAAGVSRSAPYRHYADKAALMRALAERALRQIARRIRHGAEHHQGEWQRLRAGCQAYIDYAVERPHHYQLVFGDTPIAEPDPGLEEAADNAMAAVGELVAQAQDSGSCSMGWPLCRSLVISTSPGPSTGMSISRTCSTWLWNSSGRHEPP